MKDFRIDALEENIRNLRVQAFQEGFNAAKRSADAKLRTKIYNEKADISIGACNIAIEELRVEAWNNGTGAASALEQAEAMLELAQRIARAIRIGLNTYNDDPDLYEGQVHAEKWAIDALEHFEQGRIGDALDLLDRYENAQWDIGKWPRVKYPDPDPDWEEA